MRPTKLTMAAFGPYAGVTEVNLDSLGEEGIYLICGDTGAGKTTIFDAICYALYGEASGDGREGEMLRSKYASEETKTEVTLEFVHAKKNYKISRGPSYERTKKKDKSQTTTEQGIVSLIMPDGSTYTKKAEVNAKIKEILGVDAKQFKQIVMLAQGAFQKLLMSETKDRQVIFRELFHTGTFLSFQSQVAEENKRILVQKEQAGNSISQYVSGICCEEDDPLSVQVRALSAYSPTSEITQVVEKLIERDEKEKLEVEKAHEQLLVELGRVNQVIGRGEQLAKTKQSLSQAQETLTNLMHDEETVKKAYETAKNGLIHREELLSREATLKTQLPLYQQLDTCNQAILTLDRQIAKGKKEVEEDKADKLRLEKLCQELAKEALSLKDTDKQKEQTATKVTNLEDEGRRISDLVARCQKLKEQRQTIRQQETAVKKLQEEYRQADEIYSQMDRLWRAGQAGILAETLLENQPCPVCGSTNHPQPAIKACEVPSDAQLKEAKDKVDGIGVSHNEARNALSTLQSAYVTRMEEWERLYREVVPALPPLQETGEQEDYIQREEALQAALSWKREDYKRARDEYQRLDKQSKRLQEIEEESPKQEGKLKALTESLHEKELALVANQKSRDENEKHRNEIATGLSFYGSEELIAAMEKLQKEAMQLVKAHEQSKQALDAHNAKRDGLIGEIKGYEEQLKGQEEIVLSSWQAKRDTLLEERAKQEERLLTIAKKVSANNQALAGIKKESLKLVEIETHLQWISNLSDTFGGKLKEKDKIMLETYIQMSYFDHIIERANTRLRAMSDDQYELKRMEDAQSRQGQSGLDLAVIDYTNMSERSVKTLSGGESFMASLSLALGLSDEIQSLSGGVEIDCLFVDEGFGTLDANSLDQAYRALVGLTQGHRLVGIISHVEELKARVDKRVDVTKKKDGGSELKIVV